MVKANPRDAEIVTIKKYANRRLYNTATSSYVTLEHLAQMIKKGENFAVYDAKSGDEITRSVLTQIIVEEEAKGEAKGEAMLPINFLRQLISLYGGNMQWLVPQYLDYSMESFSKNQETFRDYIHDAMGGIFPFKSLEEMGRQNMAMFQRTMRIFTPAEEAAEAAKTAKAAKAPKQEEEITSLDELTQKLEELQRQFIALTEKQNK